MASAYSRLVLRRPLLTKSLAGMALGGCGDYTAQRFEGSSYDRRRECASKLLRMLSMPKCRRLRSQEDWHSHLWPHFGTGRACITFSSTSSGRFLSPLGSAHCCQRWRVHRCDNPLARDAEYGSSFQLYIDCYLSTLTLQLIVNPFIYLPLFYTWTAVVQHRSVAETIDKVRREYWVTLKATWLLFVPFNVFNFTLVPVRHQATSVAAFSFLYNTTLSAIANAESKGNGWIQDLFLGSKAKSAFSNSATQT